MKIDMNLLPMKGHYFLFNAGTAPVVPFIPTLAKELGFSSFIVGIVYTFLPIMGMIAKPSMGALADRFHCQKIIFLLFIVLVMVFFIFIPFIPPLPSDSKANIHCNLDSVVQICSESLSDNCYLKKITDFGSENSTIKCTMSCKAEEKFIESVCTKWNQSQFCGSPHRLPVNQLLAIAKKQAGVIADVPGDNKKPVTLAPQTLSFNAYLSPKHTVQIGKCIYIRLQNVEFQSNVMVIPYCDSLQEANCEMSCDNAVISEISLNPKLKDSEIFNLYQFWMFAIFLVLSWVGQAVIVSIGDTICFELLGDNPSKYGNQRLWGSVGWGLFSVIAGLIVDKFSDGQKKNYFPAFVLMLIMLFLDLVVSSRIKYKQLRTSSSILRDMGKLLSEVKIVIFLIWCICVGMCTAMLWNFLFWYLEDLATAHGCETKAWIKTLEGLAMGIQCFGGELPFFFLSGWILKKIGHINAMTLVLFVLGVRFLLYSVLTNPWWCLPIELLNGLTFGLFYAAMTSYASIVALPGTESTTQGLVGAVFEGIGVSLGSFIGGLLINHYSGSKTFLIFGIGALTCALVHFFVQYFLSRRVTVLNIHERVTTPLLKAGSKNANTEG
ncbi:sugar baby transporter isoform X3 [Rhodnius prolixus]|uniref:Putative transporter n=1 Tax=Rhodnius neglectus TaxID=72488 RepID=A0A0P4VXE9_9HEMI